MTYQRINLVPIASSYSSQAKLLFLEGNNLKQLPLTLLPSGGGSGGTYNDTPVLNRLTTLETTATALGNRTSVVETGLTGLVTQVNTLNNLNLSTRVTAVETGLTSKAGSSDLASTNTNLGSVTSRVTVNEADINGLKTRTTAAEGNISAQSTTLSNLGTRLDAAEISLTNKVGNSDTRLSNARTPTGTITTGVLAGSSYPNPASLAASGVTPGSYTNANITVASDGRVTSAANGASSSLNNIVTSTTAPDISKLWLEVSSSGIPLNHFYWAWNPVTSKWNSPLNTVYVSTWNFSSTFTAVDTVNSQMYLVSYGIAAYLEVGNHHVILSQKRVEFEDIRYDNTPGVTGTQEVTFSPNLLIPETYPRQVFEIILNNSSGQRVNFYGVTKMTYYLVRL